MPKIPSQQFTLALDYLDSLGISSSQFILQLLTEDWSWHHASKDLVEDSTIEHIFAAFQGYSTSSSRQVIDWGVATATEILRQEMCTLTNKETGFHFVAKNTTESRLVDFDIQEMATKMRKSAPFLWNLLQTLMEANPQINYKRDWARKKAEALGIARHGKSDGSAVIMDGDIEMSDAAALPDRTLEEDSYWEAFDHEEIQLVEAEDDEPEGIADTFHEQFTRLKTIKEVVCISIMMQSTNRSCNTLQSALGIFLHSCGTPETVRELLAHMGMSVSTTTINEAINNLSKEATAEMRKVGQSFLACYAYDNLDIDLKHSVPTIEKSQETLIHLTSGTLFPLHHINPSDLDCSDELWKASPFNVAHTQYSDTLKPSIDNLLTIHAEPSDPHPSGLVRRERFNAWKFLYDLIHHGPEYFQRFKTTLKDPEEVETIPLQKTRQIPLRCLDVSPSTPAQNAEALDAFFNQTGVGDPVDNPRVISAGNMAIPIAGDLLTGQHDRSLQESRGEEATPWRRYQGLFFVMGLFHLKMACADAVWRIFIHAKDARLDPNSFMAHIGQIRPKETQKITQKPGFRRMHEVIQHVGIASRLDIWRIEARKKSTEFSTLEDFAKSEPTLEDLQAMANIIAIHYVANADLNEIRDKPDQQRDKEYENSLLKQQYFLLYEEISHAMNYGDIGRVETCFLPWMMIFAGCGKHKYATEMRRYLENVHFIYPPGICRAIRMNILCNPTGKKGKFRALDWVVEHNNLYIKRIYGGKYSNHQKARIITESPLIEIYKNIRIQFEQMFCLEHKTSRHSPPKMEITFKKLTTYMANNDAHIFIPNRGSEYCLPDMMDKGIDILRLREGQMDIDNLPGEEELGDEMEEVEDDGTLDL